MMLSPSSASPNIFVALERSSIIDVDARAASAALRRRSQDKRWRSKQAGEGASKRPPHLPWEFHAPTTLRYEANTEVAGFGAALRMPSYLVAVVIFV